MNITDKAFADLTTAELYAILRLRVDVFVVEQECVYPEVDGRDTEPATRHLWIRASTPDGSSTEIESYLRVLQDPEGIRLGRVVTHPSARGRGLGRKLFQFAVDKHADQTIRIDAQAYLTHWYESFGFRPVGEQFLDAGIPHVAMTRSPTK